MCALFHQSVLAITNSMVDQGFWRISAITRVCERNHTQKCAGAL